MPSVSVTTRLPWRTELDKSFNNVAGWHTQVDSDERGWSCYGALITRRRPVKENEIDEVDYICQIEDPVHIQVSG